MVVPLLAGSDPVVLVAVLSDRVMELAGAPQDRGVRHVDEEGMLIQILPGYLLLNGDDPGGQGVQGVQDPAGNGQVPGLLNDVNFAKQ